MAYLQIRTCGLHRLPILPSRPSAANRPWLPQSGARRQGVRCLPFLHSCRVSNLERAHAFEFIWVVVCCACIVCALWFATVVARLRRPHRLCRVLRRRPLTRVCRPGLAAVAPRQLPLPSRPGRARRLRPSWPPLPGTPLLSVSRVWCGSFADSHCACVFMSSVRPAPSVPAVVAAPARMSLLSTPASSGNHRIVCV